MPIVYYNRRTYPSYKLSPTEKGSELWLRDRSHVFRISGCQWGNQVIRTERTEPGLMKYAYTQHKPNLQGQENIFVPPKYNNTIRKVLLIGIRNQKSCVNRTFV